MQQQGLRVRVFRDQFYDSGRNAFHGKAELTLVNVPGPFEPTEDAPAALLGENALGDPIVVPLDTPEGQIGPMFGGTFAHTSDSRFGEAARQYGALAIHDRFEVPR